MKRLFFILVISLFVLNSSVPVSASESIRQQVKNIFANKKKVQRNDLNKIKIVLEKEKKSQSRRKFQNGDHFRHRNLPRTRRISI